MSTTTAASTSTTTAASTSTSSTTAVTHFRGSEGDTKAACGIDIANTANTTKDKAFITCKRCMAALGRKAYEEQRVKDADAAVVKDADAAVVKDADAAVVKDADSDFPDPPVADLRKKLNELKDKVKDKVAKTAKVKAAPKPANIHLHHDRSGETLKNGSAAPNSKCRIPGPVTTNPEEVTCKVCLASMNAVGRTRTGTGGHSPANKISDEVKAARKAFRSFIARATYMAYMDSDQLGTSWTLTHTNLAGEWYQITATGREDGPYLCNDTAAGNTKGSLIATIEKLGWSCGEEK